MSPDATQNQGPDLTEGVDLAQLDQRQTLRGHVDDEPILLVRVGEDVVAVGATCTHYGGPLDEGLVMDDTVRCPWHHACFSLRTGEALGAPATDPVPRWKVEQDGDRLVVRERLGTAAPQTEKDGAGGPTGDVLILGGGAAGFACAEMLRRHGHQGGVRILSADSASPYDRPKLSKQFLAGAASEEDLPLAPDAYYPDHDIDLRLRTEAVSIDLQNRRVLDTTGEEHTFDHLVLATGSEPVQLPIPGADHSHVHTLRTVADSQAILAAASGARRAVVLGSGFIGLETCASLTQYGIEVHVVTQERLPMEKVLGEQLSLRVRSEHQGHGTTFHTQTSIARITQDTVALEDGTELPADLVVMGVGVKPRVDLAQDAGLAVDDGVVVDECLRTSAAGVYAAGDIARWRDERTGEALRVEHWVLAQRHGQHIARNILHGDEPFIDVPFFWSAHHDLKIRYVGHAQDWEELEIDGDVYTQDCAIRYRKNGIVRAIATLGRDVEALEWEATAERQSAPA